MSIGNFLRGDTVDIFQNDLGAVSAAGVTFSVTIQRHDGADVIPIVTDALMTKIAPGRWHYRYTIPSNGALGVYNCYFTRSEGADSGVVSADDFQVYTGSEVAREGVGLSSVSGTVKDAAGNVVVGATVEWWSRDDNLDPKRLMATATTDSAGKYKVYLDPGTYILIIDATGFARYTDTRTVT